MLKRRHQVRSAPSDLLHPRPNFAARDDERDSWAARLGFLMGDRHDSLLSVAPAIAGRYRKNYPFASDECPA